MIDCTNHPTLEDNNDDDWEPEPGKKEYGRIWDDFAGDYETDPSEDGYLSYYTYL